MNVSTVIGLVVTLAVFGASLITSTDNVMMFVNGHAILIVVGGTSAAALLCFPVKKVVTLLGVFFRRMLGNNAINYGRIVEDIAKLSVAMRQGKKSYEAAIAQLKDPFLKDAAEVLFWIEADSVPDDGVPRTGVVRVGEVRVLLVKVSVPANVDNVPVVGSVTPVPAVTVKVVAKLPEIVNVLAALFATPVPPEAAGSAEPRVKEVKYEAASTTFVPSL